MKDFLVCYDIAQPKRLKKVAKFLYGYAIGGQKSALDVPADAKEMEQIVSKLEALMKPKVDRVLIVEVVGEPMVLGRADFVKYDEGVIVV